MTINIDDSTKEVTTMYDLLKPIVNDTVASYSKDIDSLIKTIKNNVTTATNKELQDYMARLSIEAYYFSETKDLSTLQQDCANILYKTKQADVYILTPGTQAARANQAVIDTQDKQIVAAIYAAVANRLKSKLDEAHRLINVLSNILISRNAEAKLKGARTDDDLHSDGVREDFND